MKTTIPTNPKAKAKAPKLKRPENVRDPATVGELPDEPAFLRLKGELDNGEPVIYVFTDSEVELARARAATMKEQAKQENFLRRLLD